MSKISILIIEDDLDIQEMLRITLIKEGWNLLMATDGSIGMQLLERNAVDCILLDIMLPGMDGLGILRKIKQNDKYRSIPVILATAKGEDTDIVSGLELGADDYVVKPYSPKVLLARIRTILRRNAEDASENEKKTFWQAGGITLDSIRHEAAYHKKALDLSATEFALLQIFISHVDEVFSRNKIISCIRGDDYPVTDRSVDVQILALRRKLGKAGEMIETVRGVGYRFSVL